MKVGSDTARDSAALLVTTSQVDFRSADRCPARSRLVMRSDVHSICPPLSVIDEQQLGTADLSAADGGLEDVEDKQKTVEWRQRCDLNGSVSSSAVQAKLNSCALPTDVPSSSPSSRTKKGLGRSQSEVYHTRTDSASSSISGGRLSLSRSLDQDDGSLKFRFVVRDNLSGGVCSSTSSTLFQMAKGREENGPHDIAILSPFDGSKPPATPPPSGTWSVDCVSNVAANSPTAEATSEEPQQQLVDAESAEASAVQPRPPASKTTDDNRENHADVFDDEDEGIRLICALIG